MNAVKLLGSLLSNNAMGGSIGQKVLGSVLSGGGGGGGGAGPLGALLGGSGGGGGGALGAILGAAMGGGRNRGGGGGMAGQLLGSILGGGQQQAQHSGAAGLLGGLLGGGQQQRQPQGGGGIGGLLGGLLGGKQQPQRQAPQGGGGLGDLLGGLLGGQKPTQEHHQQLEQQAGNILDNPPSAAQDEATVLIRAMLNAAKSDGNFDQQEQQNVLGKLGEVEQSEVDFIKNELAQPLDLNEFVSEVPRGLEEQVYAFSVMGIKLDTQDEAQYLGQLAKGLRLDGDKCNAIHEQLGAPKIFS